VLFSNSEVAKFIDETFEPVWESVRPAPLVTIDFGNGHKIVRTLQGNVATSVCDADGVVHDILPGIYTPKPYREQLVQLAALVKERNHDQGSELRSHLSEYHAKRAAAMKAPATSAMLAVAKTGGGGKGGIGGFGGGGMNPPANQFVGGGGLGGGGRGGLGGTPMGVEGPLEAVLAGRPVVPATPQGGDLAARADLAFDVQVNEKVRRRLVHEYLAGMDLPRPDQLKRWLFRDVLRADLDDPLLGLGPVLSNGYPFAAEETVETKR
jgi:hypothetical protein